MKIRNGFVSNSSSSSFIFAIAEITDLDKVKSYLTDKEIERYILNKEQIKKIHSWWEDEISYDYSTGRYEFSLNKLNDESIYLILNEDGGHDDGSFWDGDDYNYDISLDRFYFRHQEIFKLIASESTGLNTIDYHFQAGRD